jgi:colanic acid/amylovoran biosynthesis glycosyltransferase
MRIAFLVDSFPLLSETFVLNQITGLLDSGHEVDVFAYSRPRQAMAHADVGMYQLEERVHYYSMPSRPTKRMITGLSETLRCLLASPRGFFRLLRAVSPFVLGRHALTLRPLHVFSAFVGREQEYDVLHCHYGPNGNLGAYLKQLGVRGKLVTMFHGYDIRAGLKSPRLYEPLMRSGDCFLAISRHNHDSLLEIGFDPERIVRHPVGIDTQRFPFKWERSTAPGGARPIRIVTVARLVPEKGLAIGLEALHRLLRVNHPRNIRYSIIGEGPLEDMLKRKANDLDLSRYVDFLGPMTRERVIDELLRSDLFFLPSVEEALPVSLMEAQAVGLPIVATATGSVDEVVIDGGSGFLAPPGDVESLSIELERVVDTPGSWPGMGRKGRAYVEHNYDIRVLNMRLTDMYDALLDDEPDLTAFQGWRPAIPAGVFEAGT